MFSFPFLFTDESSAMVGKGWPRLGKRHKEKGKKWQGRKIFKKLLKMSPCQLGGMSDKKKKIGGMDSHLN